MKYEDFITKFYNTLWTILMIIIGIAIVVFLIWTRIKFDAWYINWLIH